VAEDIGLKSNRIRRRGLGVAEDIDLKVIGSEGVGLVWLRV
jgi:hypothetical protein